MHELNYKDAYLYLVRAVDDLVRYMECRTKPPTAKPSFPDCGRHFPARKSAPSTENPSCNLCFAAPLL